MRNIPFIDLPGWFFFFLGIITKSVKLVWKKISGGAIVNFVASMMFPIKELLIKLEPQQDLHGYDRPWPAGGGVNKFDISTVEQGSLASATGEETDSTTRIRCGFLSVKEQTVYRLETDNKIRSCYLYYYNADKEFISNSTEFKNLPVTFATPVNTAYFRGVFRLQDNEPIVPSDLTWGLLKEGTAAADWTPYENICPITGHTGENTYVRGKNLADINLLETTEITLEDGVASGKAGAFEVFRHGINGLAFPKGVQLTMSVTAYTDAEQSTDGTGIYFAFLYTDGTNRSLSFFNNLTTPTRRTITSHADKTIDKIIMTYSSKNLNTWHLYDWQLEIGTSTTDFVPYDGSTTQVNFPNPPGTVYGCTVDPVSGVLMVDKGRVDLGDLEWDYNTSYAYPFFISTDSIDNADKTLAELTTMCESYKAITNKNSSNFRANNYDNQICFSASLSGQHLMCQDSAITDKTTFTNNVKGVHLVFDIVTPIVYQLTPQQINALKDENNIWVENGEIVEVTFRK